MILDVHLKNGSFECESSVRTIARRLEGLREVDLICLSELVEKCRDDNYVITPGSACVLRRLILVKPRGGIYRAVRNVVLSAARGEGFELTIESPLMVPTPFADEKIVTLKNGKQYTEAAVDGIMLSLTVLQSLSIATFFELIAKCRNDAYAFLAAGQSARLLKRLGLMTEDGVIRPCVRDVALCAVPDIPIELGSPY